MSPLPPGLLDRLYELNLSVSHPQAARLVWERLLSTEERIKLGGDAGAAIDRCANGARLVMRVRRVWQPRAIIDAARAVGLLADVEYHHLARGLHEYDPIVRQARRPGSGSVVDDAEAAARIETSRSKFKLVLIEAGPWRRAYWKGVRIPVDWGRQNMPWEFLVRLAERGRRGGAVEPGDLTPTGTEKAIVHRRRRLKALLPLGLDRLIKARGERLSYNLDLPGRDIDIIKLDADERWALDDED